MAWYSNYSYNQSSGTILLKKNIDKKKNDEENEQLKIEEIESKEKEKEKNDALSLEEFINRMKPRKVVYFYVSKDNRKNR